MKKLYFIFLISISMLITANAQTTLTYENQAPLIGDVFHQTFVDSTGLDPGPAGPNVTWDFATLTVTSNLTSTTISPSSTPFGDDFPEANTAFEYDDASSVYIFEEITPSVINDYGYAFEEGIIFHYSNPSKWLVFPFSYNDSYTDDFFGEGSYLLLTTHNCGTLTVTADAYGTITTPKGTFNDVLRVKSFEEYTDSIFTAGIFIYCVTGTQTNYSWYSSNSKIPVFNICISIVDYITDKSGYYSTPSTSIEENNEAFDNIKVFPNPANDFINIASELPVEKVKLINCTGQIVITTDVFNNNFSINVSRLEAGLYILQFETKDAIRTKKITIR